MLRYLAVGSGGSCFTLGSEGRREAHWNPWEAGAMEEGLSDRNHCCKGTQPLSERHRWRRRRPHKKGLFSSCFTAFLIG